MSFQSFLSACAADPDVQLTHFICADADHVINEFVQPPHRMDTLKLFYSMTKSMSSIAIGIASDMGLVSLDDYLHDIFPEYVPENPDPNMMKIRVRDLLTMSGGIHDDTYLELFPQPNWVKAYMAQTFQHEPGTHFRYCTHGSHVLSAIITKVTGLSMEAFLNQRLLFPMGIREARWEHAPEGLVSGGMGYSMKPMSLLKMGQMLLNKGVYGGRRYLSEEYVAEASRAHIRKNIAAEIGEYTGDGYGFQFHVGKEDYFRFDGSFGQMCLICPAINRVFVGFSRNSKHEPMMKHVFEHLIGEELVEGENIEAAPLFPVPADNKAFVPACSRYGVADNVLGVKEVAFLKANDENVVRFTRADGRIDDIAWLADRQVNGQAIFVKDLEDHVQEYACTATVTDNSVRLDVCWIETPYNASYTFTFDGDDLQFDFDVNVSFTLSAFSVKGEKLA